MDGRHFRGLLYLTISLWLGSCGEPTAHGPISLSVLSGADQRGLPGEELAEPIVVRVTDDQGPVQGVLINFVVVAGGGQVFAGAALTNSRGEARERWTLGWVGENVIEARGVDQTTGEAIVYARITAYAVPGPVATLTVYPDFQMNLLDSVLDVAPLVYAVDADGNYIPNPPLALTAPAPLQVMGTTVRADREAIGQVTIASGSVATSLEAHFMVDLTRIRWRISYRCYDGFLWEGGGTAEVDSAVTVVVSDSVKHENFDSRGPTTRIYLWSTGTTTTFLADGRVTTAPAQADPRRPLVFIQAVGKVLYYPHDGGNTTTSEGTSDGALPPTYTGGNLCPSVYDRFSPAVLEPAP
jgi:hypothetical protein